MKSIVPETVGLSPVRLKRIDEGMQRYVDHGQVSGIVTVLARHGKVAHTGCYGKMDIASDQPMREDAIFRIYSMTKPITSLAVLMLFEEGRFQLSSPVSLFIPEFAQLQVLKNQMDHSSERVAIERPITIFDLLTHTSGLGYGLDNSTPVDTLWSQARLMRMDETLTEKMIRLTQLPLHHQPGLRYTYSFATDVLGRMVEIVSGMSVDEFFKQRIFEPLGMVDTGFHIPLENHERLATLYTPDQDGSLVDITTVDPATLPDFLTEGWIDKREKPLFLSGGGGLVSTASDYLRFALMLANHGALEGTRLVSRKTIELMTAPHLRPEQFFMPGCSSGLGVTVVTDPARMQMLGSIGAYGGGGAANTDFWVDPREGLVGVLMVQYVAYSPMALILDFKTLAAQAISD